MQTKTLFSQHYLQNRLAGYPEWAADPTPTLNAIRPLWQGAVQYGAAWNEAQTNWRQ